LPFGPGQSGPLLPPIPDVSGSQPSPDEARWTPAQDQPELIPPPTPATAMPENESGSNAE